MKAKKLLAVLLGGALCMAAAVPAMAANELDAVYLSLVSEMELYDLTPGESIVETTPEAASDSYRIADCDITTTMTSGGVYTYVLDVYAQGGARFSKNTMVSVYGAYDISVDLRSTTRMRVRAKAYPFRVLGEVTGIQIDAAGKEAYWTPVDGAKSYSVIIYFADSDGRVRHAKSTVHETKIGLSNYIDRYDYVEVAVRAARGSGTSDRYTAEANYMLSGGGIDEENYVDVYDFRLPTATYGKLPDGTTGVNPFNPHAVAGGGSTSSGGNSGSTAGEPVTAGPLAGSGTVSPAAGGQPAGGSAAPSQTDGWQGSGDNWYYLRGGARVTGWLGLTADEWYFMDNSGLMSAGWFNDNGTVYLLNPAHDGSYGKMLAGYQYYNGFLYYFNEAHDGSYGAMFRNRTTPDGRWADNDGIVR